MMAVAAAQKNRELFAIKKSYSIEVSSKLLIESSIISKLFFTFAVLFVSILNSNDFEDFIKKNIQIDCKISAKWNGIRPSIV